MPLNKSLDNSEEIAVSVIIPVYNVEKYLEDCLNSVINQDLPNIEIICVNDGSTDNSKIILDKYLNKIENMKVIDQENKGLSDARNTGLKYAKGKFIYFLDSDDMLKADSLKEMYEFANYNNLDILYFDGEAKYESELLYKRLPWYEKQYIRSKEYGIREHGIDLFCEMVNNSDYIVSSCLLLIRSSYIKEIDLSYYSGILHEDNLFNFKAMLKAKKVGHISKRYFIRRIRENSIVTSNKSFKHFWGYFVTYNEMINFLSFNNKIIDNKYKVVITKVINNILKEARDLYNNLIIEEKNKINDLPLDIQIKINNLVIDNVSSINDEMCVFPYYLLPPNSNIVLYGAGDIGQKYYQQLKFNDYLNVIKWVDKNWEHKRAEGLLVDNIESLINVNYDFVFIAVANKDIVKNIIIKLEKLGVPKNKIIWPGEEFVVKQSLINKRLEIYKQVFFSQKRKIFLFMTPEHGNLGDYAIAMAEREFIKKYFPNLPYIEVTMPDWEKFSNEYKKIVFKDDIVFFSGGGYLGDMWNSGNIVKDIIIAFEDNIKIMFPNTLTYKNNSEEAMKRDAKFYALNKNLYIFARDKKTYDKLIEFGYRDKRHIALFPDMALNLNYSKSQLPRNNILLCFREDLEKSLTEAEIGKIKNCIEKLKLNYKFIDIHLNRLVSRENGEAEVLNKIEEFKKAKLVITDRLHGMIFAVITGTPCIAFNNSTGKIAGVYKWVENLPYICFYDVKNFSEGNILKMYNLENCVYENEDIINKSFEMQNFIKMLINKLD